MKIAYIIIMDFLLGCLLVSLEFFGFSARLHQLENTTEEMWKESFLIGAIIGIFFASCMSLLWYACAEWVFIKIDNSQDVEGKRKWWVIFLFVSAAGSAACAFLFLESGSTSIFPWFALNGFLCYYLPTLLFSPSVFKFIPWGAARIR